MTEAFIIACCFDAQARGYAITPHTFIGNPEDDSSSSLGKYCCPIGATYLAAVSNYRRTTDADGSSLTDDAVADWAAQTYGVDWRFGFTAGVDGIPEEPMPLPAVVKDRDAYERGFLSGEYVASVFGISGGRYDEVPVTELGEVAHA